MGIQDNLQEVEKGHNISIGVWHRIFFLVEFTLPSLRIVCVCKRIR